jgi:hypothetical protein
MWQIAGRIERPIGRYVSAFGTARCVTAGDIGLGGFAGLRLGAIEPLAPPRAAGIAIAAFP